jgi:catalase-peroxidase
VKLNRQLFSHLAVLGVLFNLVYPLVVFSDSLPNDKPLDVVKPKTNQFWWPSQLDLSPLRKNTSETNPLGKTFNYATAFNTLDLKALKKDINALLTTSQPWWPSDFGHYGPLFIRMAWHSAGTYRLLDGRGGADGGQQRFEPLNSWPDNANLDKARRLLWPIKQKYGANISWSDLMVLAGNVALENMGFKTLGFAGGRQDEWEADLVYWGPEGKFLASERRDASGQLEKPLGAVQMGLIYVNPEGPNGVPDPLAAAMDIREAFGRMAMNDEETVALIAGGHTLGKAHGAVPAHCLGKEPAGAALEAQGLGWANQCGTGSGNDTHTSGLEGAWTSTPTQWTMQYLDNLLNYNWVQVKSPAGAIQWIPELNGKAAPASLLAPSAQAPLKKSLPMMFTTDLALKFDPSYQKIAHHFHQNPKQFELAFAKAWFKLTHRDMGPRGRYLGADAPKQALLWQDPVPAVDHALINQKEVQQLKARILATGLTIPELTRVAWASAASFRSTDLRGGANGARIRLLPQKNWAVNNPKALSTTLGRLEATQKAFNAQLPKGKKVSLADTIVLAGNAAIEKAAEQAGQSIQLPFTPGRTDAEQAQTDIEAFAVLEPTADAFRQYFAVQNTQTPVQGLIERASMLNLTIPEMTVLLGGMRALNANYDQSDVGVLTQRPGVLSNDFFVNLLDMSTVWKPSAKADGVYHGFDRQTGRLKWSASAVDLVFGSNSELRAVSEVYAADNAKQQFVQDFANAWTKVMQLDRYEHGQKL